MKYIFLSILALSIFQSCETENTLKHKKGVPSFELGQNGKDTINRLDHDSIKQGLWIETPNGKSDIYSKDKDTVIYKNGIIIERKQ